MSLGKCWVSRHPGPQILFEKRTRVQPKLPLSAFGYAHHGPETGDPQWRGGRQDLTDADLFRQPYVRALLARAGRTPEEHEAAGQFETGFGIMPVEDGRSHARFLELCEVAKRDGWWDGATAGPEFRPAADSGHKAATVNKAVAATGKWPGVEVPYGYGKQDDGLLVPVPGEVGAVRSMFAHYLKTKSVMLTCTAMNAESRMRSGNYWTIATVGRMLVNPVYAGTVQWHGVVVLNAHEALVDDATWDRVQALLTRARP